MARPATMFYWRGRGYATDAGSKRTMLVKGPRSKRNRELAIEKLAALLGTRQNGQSNGAPSSAENGATAEPKTTNPTIAVVIDQFRELCKARCAAGELKASTLESFYIPYLRQLENSLGSCLVSHITRAKVLEYRTRLVERGVGPNTVKNHLGALRTCMRWAKKNGLAASVDLDAVPCLPRRRRETLPTADEVQRLLKASREDVRDVLETLLNIAVRPGDLYNLRRASVDLEAGLLRLPDSKTGARLVCLVPKVREILNRRLQMCPSPDDYVFTTIRGKPWTIRYFAQLVRETREQAGLGPHLTAYVLRHVWTTTAFLNGLDLATVRALRSDRDPRTTLIYEHLASHVGHLQEAALRAVGGGHEAGPRSRRGRPDGRARSRRRARSGKPANGRSQ